MKTWANLPTRVIADLLGRNTPSRRSDVSALEVQDRKDEFVALLFDNVERGVLTVAGCGSRDHPYRFVPSCPGFGPDWQPTEEQRLGSAVRAWAHIDRLRDDFSDFYAARHGRAA